MSDDAQSGFLDGLARPNALVAVRGGYDYYVSDVQIATYSALPIHVRLAWVEETARVAYELSTPEVRARWAALRRGEPMPSPEQEPAK